MRWWQQGSLPQSLLPIAAAAEVGDVAVIEALAAARGSVAIRADVIRPSYGKTFAPGAAFAVVKYLSDEDLVSLVFRHHRCLEAAGQMLLRTAPEAAVRPMHEEVVKRCHTRGASITAQMAELQGAPGDAAAARLVAARLVAAATTVPEVQLAAAARCAVQLTHQQLSRLIEDVVVLGRALEPQLQSGRGRGREFLSFVMKCARYGQQIECARRADAADAAATAAATAWGRAVGGAPPLKEDRSHLDFRMPSLERLPAAARHSYSAASRIAWHALPSVHEHAKRASHVAIISSLASVCHSVAPQLLLSFASYSVPNAKLAAALLGEEVYRLVVRANYDGDAPRDVYTQFLLSCSVLPPRGHPSLLMALRYLMDCGEASLPLMRMLIPEVEPQQLQCMPNCPGSWANALVVACLAPDGPNPGAVRALVELGGMDVNARLPGRGGEHILVHLVRDRAEPWAIEALLTLGARVDIPGGDAKESALVVAAGQRGKTAILEMLIRAGADVHAGMDMAMRKAVHLRHEENAALLYSAGSRYCWLSGVGASLELHYQGGGTLRPASTELDWYFTHHFAVPAEMRAADWRVRKGLAAANQEGVVKLEAVAFDVDQEAERVFADSIASKQPPQME